MATDLVKNNLQFFLDGFLSRQPSSIPKGAQWAVTFDNLESSILPSITKAYSYEPGNNKWKTEQSASIILTDEYQKTRGCLFCQAIGLPGESMVANIEGNINSNAFIRSYVGGGRNAFPIMRMTFLDTYTSFCDSFLRGWALATSNFGMIARSKGTAENYRTNLTCYKFGVTPDGPYIIQRITFDGICCISVSEEEYNYVPVSAPVLREAQFVYNSYSIDTDEGKFTKAEAVSVPTPMGLRTTVEANRFVPPPATMAQSSQATAAGIAGTNRTA